MDVVELSASDPSLIQSVMAPEGPKMEKTTDQRKSIADRLKE